MPARNPLPSSLPRSLHRHLRLPHRATTRRKGAAHPPTIRREGAAHTHAHTHNTTMSSVRQAAAKLHMVTLVRSPCNRPRDVRETLGRLGLTRMSQSVVHKNTPAVNGMLRKVMEHVDVVPVTFAPEAPAAAHANSVAYGENVRRPIIAPLSRCCRAVVACWVILCVCVCVCIYVSSIIAPLSRCCRAVVACRAILCVCVCVCIYVSACAFSLVRKRIIRNTGLYARTCCVILLPAAFPHHLPHLPIAAFPRLFADIIADPLIFHQAPLLRHS